MAYYKNGKLEKVKGGYLVTYDKCVKSADAYDGFSYVGNKKEVFTEGSKAIAKLDAIYDSEMKYNKAMESHKSTPKMDKDESDY